MCASNDRPQTLPDPPLKRSPFYYPPLPCSPDLRPSSVAARTEPEHSTPCRSIDGLQQAPADPSHVARVLHMTGFQPCPTHYSRGRHYTTHLPVAPPRVAKSSQGRSASQLQLAREAAAGLAVGPERFGVRLAAAAAALDAADDESSAAVPATARSALQLRRLQRLSHGR